MGFGRRLGVVLTMMKRTAKETAWQQYGVYRTRSDAFRQQCKHAGRHAMIIGAYYPDVSGST